MNDTDRTASPEPEAVMPPGPRPAVKDWDNWTYRYVWTLEQAAHLLLGLEPPEGEPWSMQDTREWTPGKVYARLKSACRHPQAKNPLPHEQSANGQISNKRSFPQDIVSWARREGGIPLAPELETHYPATETISKEAATSRYARKSPGPELPFQQRRELTETFNNVGVDWERATKDNATNDLCSVKHEKKHGPRGYLYDPEGVAEWLIHHEKKKANRVAAAILELIDTLKPTLGEKALAKKQEFWEQIEAGS